MSGPPPFLPTIVGAGAVVQRSAAPGEAAEAVDLMAAAAASALADAGTAAGARDLAARLDWIGVPDGTWGYPDPGRLLAERLGARPGVHTVLADVGITQQELLSRACAAIAEGEAEVALVVGGEARWRAQQARRAGIEVPETAQGDARPDTHLQPHDLGIHDVEIERNIVNPTISYALIDRALAHRRGWSAAVHRDRLGALWARFAVVAADNPHAWDRTGPSARQIRDPGEGNRLLAYPYTRAMASQWNVDQAAAVVLCSADRARSLGVPDGRPVTAWAATVANHAVPLVARPHLDRSPGAAVAGARLLELAGLDGLAGVAHVDLYSCFPAAVWVYAAELGLRLEPPYDDPPTVTGGMSFAGGPLNNYVLQALVRLVERLRRDPGSVGLSSSVSGFLTKQGFSLWSTAAPPVGYRARDVTDEVAAAGAARPVDPGLTGVATVVAGTVERTGFEPRTVAVVEDRHGTRTVAATTEPGVVAAVEDGAPVLDPGTPVHLDGEGGLALG